MSKDKGGLKFTMPAQHVIRDVGRLRAAKVYAWQLLQTLVGIWSQRGICPSDVDAVMESHGVFLWFEMKTSNGLKLASPLQAFPNYNPASKSMDGQETMWRRLFDDSGSGAHTLVVLRHEPEIDTTETAVAICAASKVVEFAAAWRWEGQWQYSRWFDGDKLAAWCEKWTGLSANGRDLSGLNAWRAMMWDKAKPAESDSND